MNEEKDALLQQILENSRESLVYFQKAVGEPPFRLESEYSTVPIYYDEMGTGFFVESDKVVTTIDVLVGGIDVTASFSKQFETKGIVTPHDIVKRMTNKYHHPSDTQNLSQINEAAFLTIEGVTAFDPKNNLVLLKVAETGTPLPLGNSDTVQIQELVYILGHFEDIGAVGVVGKVGSRYRNNTWLQISTQFFSAACGGPVLNANNEVVGIAATGTEFPLEDESTAFSRAISSNLIKTLMANSDEVVSLAQWEKYSRVRAHILESDADEKSYLQDNRAAIKDYNKALRLNPDIVEIYAKRGMVKTRIGNVLGALRDFNKAIEINPQDTIAYNNRASAKGILGDVHGMLDDINQALQINPHYILGRLNRGQAKCQMAELEIEDENIPEAQRLYQEAIEDFIKILELNPKHTFARRRTRTVERTLKKLNSENKKSNRQNSLNS